MTKITNSLLKEAIADADSVRESAIANAKIQLEESIGPAIKEEITKALSETGKELDEGHNPHVAQTAGDFAKVEEQFNDDTSGVGTGDNKQPSKATSDSSGIGKGGESGNGEGETPDMMDEDNTEEVLDDLKDNVEVEGEDLSEDTDLEELDEGVLDLEAIIRELQREVEMMAAEGYGDDEYNDDEDEFGGGDEFGGDAFGGDDMGRDDMGRGDMDVAPVARDFDDEEEVEEDFDLDAVLREIEAELSEETQDDIQVAEQNAKLKEELAQYRKAVEILRVKLDEVNLLNAKLLYTNKLFKGRELSQGQKVHVVETFDLATTLREIKLLYATLAEATINVPGKGSDKKKVSTNSVVTEGVASTVVGSTAPKETQEEVIEEGFSADFKKRMQQLAGVQVL